MTAILACTATVVAATAFAVHACDVQFDNAAGNAIAVTAHGAVPTCAPDASANATRIAACGMQYICKACFAADVGAVVDCVIDTGANANIAAIHETSMCMALARHTLKLVLVLCLHVSLMLLPMPFWLL